MISNKLTNKTTVKKFKFINNKKYIKKTLVKNILVKNKDVIYNDLNNIIQENFNVYINNVTNNQKICMIYVDINLDIINGKNIWLSHTINELVTQNIAVICLINQPFENEKLSTNILNLTNIDLLRFYNIPSHDTIINIMSHLVENMNIKEIIINDDNFINSISNNILIKYCTFVANLNNLNSLTSIKNKCNMIWVYKDELITELKKNNINKIKKKVYNYDIIKLGIKKHNYRDQIIFVGKIRDEDNILELIDDFKKISKFRNDIKLVICYSQIIGNENFIKTIEDIINSNIKNIEFKKNLNQKDILKEISNSSTAYLNRKTRYKITNKEAQYKLFDLFICKSIDIFKSTTINKLNIACIFDKFTFESMKYEFNLFYINQNNWEDIFKNNFIDFLFCESAWNGLDGEWKDKIYYRNSKVDTKIIKFGNRIIKIDKNDKTVDSELLKILNYCKDNNIKTIFWNKEDPLYYKNPNLNFDEIMSMFDYKFSTSKNCIELYPIDLNFTVNLLEFGFQPKLFNPINTFKNSINNTVLFTGSWYPYYVNRCNDFDLIYNFLNYNALDLLIYNRFSNDDSKKNEYPKKYKNFVHQAVEYNELCDLYKKYKLNIINSTVKKCPTMVARRIFEIAASGSFMFTNNTVAINNYFGNTVKIIDKIEKYKIDNELIKKNIIKNINIVFQNFRYENILLNLFRSIGIFYKPKFSDIELVYTESNLEIKPYLYQYMCHYDYLDKNTIIAISDKDEDNFFEFTTKKDNYTFIYQKHMQKYFEDNNIEVYLMPYFANYD